MTNKGVIMKNLKFLVILSLLASMAFLMSHNSRAGITVSSIGAGVGSSLGNVAKGVQQCSNRAVRRTISTTLNKVDNYVNGLKTSAQGIIDLPADTTKELKTSFKTLGTSTQRIVNDVIEPINKAYGSLNNTINGNVDTLLSMTEAMKSGKNFTGHVYNGDNKISKAIKSSDMAHAMNDVIAYIPTINDISKGQSDLKSKRLATSKDAVKGTSAASKNLKNIEKFQKIVNFAGADNFNVNDLIRDSEKLESVNRLMNLSTEELPSSLSQGIQAMNLAGDVYSFATNGVAQFQMMQDIITTITSVKALTDLQEDAMKIMEAATAVVSGFNAITDMISAFDSGSANSFVSGAKSARSSYKTIRANVSDVKESIKKMKEMAEEVKALKEAFKKNIDQVQDSYDSSLDISDLFDKIALVPGMSDIVSGYKKYLDVTSKAKSFQKDLLNFGESSVATDNVINTVKPYAKDVENKVVGWKNDFKDMYGGKSKTGVDAEIEKDASLNNKAKTLFVKLKSNAKSLNAKKAKIKANISYLKSIQVVGSTAYTKLVAVENSLSNLPNSAQVTQFAKDGLGITETSKDVLSAYKKINNFQPSKITKTLDGFTGKLEELGDVQHYMKDYNNIVTSISNSPQMLNALAGNIKNLGGLLKCFNLDPEAIAKDLLLRTKDQLMDHVKGKLWKAVGKATGGIPFLMLPRDLGNHYEIDENGFKKRQKPLWEDGASLNRNLINESTAFFTQQQVTHDEFSDLNSIASNSKLQNNEIHPLTGLQFAGITIGSGTTSESTSELTIDVFRNPNQVEPKMTDYGNKDSLNLNYRHTMSAWKFDAAPKVSARLDGIDMDHGDFKARSYLPFNFKCGFGSKTSFCWYWKWHSCAFISKCYPVPYPLPSCETILEYKEPTVHVEVSPRAATSHIANLSFLKDIPSTVEVKWAAGAKSAVPNAHVMGISPIARYVSKLGPFFGNHTMACDLAEKWETFEYIQVYGVPLPSIKMAMTMGLALYDLKDWNVEWFNIEAPLIGAFPAPLAGLYVTELDKAHWNPRTYPGGLTPTGETYPDFDASRTEAYEYALPYEAIYGVSGTLVRNGANIFKNKCDAGIDNGSSVNKCMGEWGALLPRNGQVATHDPRYPLRRYAQLGYRAYDRMLEGEKDSKGVVTRNISAGKVQKDVTYYGKKYNETEFSLEWPYTMKKRKSVGTHPSAWQEGYFGKAPTSGGMVMTYWRDTGCCIKACCPVIDFEPGETYPWGGGSVLRKIYKLEVKEWAIAEVIQKKVNSEDESFQEFLLSDGESKGELYKGCLKSKVHYLDVNKKPKVRNKTEAECKSLFGDVSGIKTSGVDTDKMKIVYDKCIKNQTKKVCMRNVYGISNKSNCISNKYSSFSERECHFVFPEYPTMTKCLEDGFSYNTCRRYGVNGSILSFSGINECLNVGYSHAVCKGYGLSYPNLDTCLVSNTYSTCDTLGLGYLNHAVCMNAGKTAAVCTSYGL